MAKRRNTRAYTMLVINPDGGISMTTLTEAPKYEQLKNAVDGYIETIPYFTKLKYLNRHYVRGRAYCNEEGKLMGLPRNPRAEEFWRASCPTGDPSHMTLAGSVVFYAIDPQDKPEKG